MVTVKLLGGAKKSFSTEKIELDVENLTINELLSNLLKNKPNNTPDLDTKNILVAVNGIDSSALEGRATKISKDDIVSIIPVIHGGSPRIKLKIGRNQVELIHIKSKHNLDESFLDSLRKKYPKLIIQAISSKFILNSNHAKKIIMLSLDSKKNNTLLSNKIETDMLMRFACTTQISDAISKAGINPNTLFTIISIGPKSIQDKLYKELESFLSKSKINSEPFLKKEFKISKKHLDAVDSQTPLEDILVEKAAVLFG
ncbi:MAG: thiamine biosynthesis protein ThiS [Crenarchaeota archaeon]|nr:MAG: thiamine biosynthesis protein ThiS [Thermoproteota archaeon]RDJ33058.1 MAG: thiamine biosynthesis protein ThiS [Thermoproteota archaeon]RDJ36438.1 MAG: thiamine biosynthesis protein ThiS [Thermoproteota archaeon]RDJ39066.1 MAG: thiamine biosynthesis protein ThiS [Thermoproteota archaeon]